MKYLEKGIDYFFRGLWAILWAMIFIIYLVSVVVVGVGYLIGTCLGFVGVSIYMFFANAIRDFGFGRGNKNV